MLLKDIKFKNKLFNYTLYLDLYIKDAFYFIPINNSFSVLPSYTLGIE